MPTAAHLTSGGTTSPATSVSTASITPGANRLIVVEVRAENGGGTAPVQPTLSGNGLTWVQVATRTYTDGATETHRITRFRAMGASPTSGAITINHSTAPNSGINWKVVEFADVDTTGTNGSGAVVQTVTNGGTGTTASATLAAFGDATNNAASIGVGAFGMPTISPESSWTALGSQQNHFSALHGAWRLGQDTSPSMTLSSSQVWAAIASEIKAASAGGGGAPFYYNWRRRAA